MNPRQTRRVQVETKKGRSPTLQMAPGRGGFGHGGFRRGLS